MSSQICGLTVALAGAIAINSLTINNVTVNDNFAGCWTLASYSQDISHLPSKSLHCRVAGYDIWKLMRSDMELFHEFLSFFLRKQFMLRN